MSFCSQKVSNLTLKKQANLIANQVFLNLK